MPFIKHFRRSVTILAAGTVWAGGYLFVQAADESKADGGDVKSTQTNQTPDNDVPRVTIAVARDRAKLMHDIYSATLDVMHDRYFHADRAVVPARAMEDVFSEMEQQSGFKANWIAVNLRAMSINHEPNTEFEKQAARAIAAGEQFTETIDEGFYRRAGAIPMRGGCVSCHGGFANKPTKAEKFAGLVISIPVLAEPEEQ